VLATPRTLDDLEMGRSERNKDRGCADHRPWALCSSGAKRPDAIRATPPPRLPTPGAARAKRGHNAQKATPTMSGYAQVHTRPPTDGNMDRLLLIRRLLARGSRTPATVDVHIATM